MTCIIGFVDDLGSIYMGGDSAWIGGGSHSYGISSRDKKVFRNGKFLIGPCGHIRQAQLLRYRFKPPARGNMDVQEYMRTKFVDSVRACFKKYGYQYKDKEREFGGTFMVAHDGYLFSVFETYQVSEQAYGFMAIGSGYRVAYGALEAIARLSDICPEEKVIMALEITAKFDAYVEPPFHVEML